MRRLVLVRHATAEGGTGRPDRERRLTAQGRAEAARVGAWLRAQRLVPDHAAASPAARAWDTAAILAKELGLPAGLVRAEGRLYEAGPADLLRWLGCVPASAGTVLAVAHNPALEQVALHLTGDEDLDRLGLAPAGVVVAELPDDWDDLGARSAVSWRVLRPGDLLAP